MQNVSINEADRRQRIAALHERVKNGDPATQLCNLFEVIWREAEVETEELREAEQQLQVQLAGCGVAAMGGTTEPVVVKRSDYGWSPSYQSVLDLRQKYDALYEALVGDEPDNPQIQPLGWLRTLIDEFKRLYKDSGSDAEDDPDATWQMITEVERLHDSARAALARATPNHRAIESGMPPQPIVTTYNPKPIPVRSFDWEAVRGDYDLGCSSGFGATEAEAIADLKMQEDE